MNNTCMPTSVLLIVLGLLPSGALPQMAGARIPGGCDVAAATGDDRTVGCYLNATEDLKSLPPGELFWHLYQYPTRAAADAAKPIAFGTVTQALGKVWLYAIQTEDWRAQGGERVAVIGPLPVQRDKHYTARYMQAVFRPGMETAVHTHSGPQAWYIVSGVQCLRTPDGVSVTRAGAGAVVPAGPAMVLTSLGAEMRRSVLLVLHDSSQSWMTIATDWKPDTECPRQ